MLHLVSLFQVWVRPQLVGHRCLRPVARQYGRFGRELLADMPQARHYVGIAALPEVGSANAHLEKRVARKRHLFFLAVEEYRAGRMAWRMQHGELMVAKLHCVVVGKQAAGMLSLSIL